MSQRLWDHFDVSDHAWVNSNKKYIYLLLWKKKLLIFFYTYLVSRKSFTVFGCLFALINCLQVECSIFHSFFAWFTHWIGRRQLNFQTSRHFQLSSMNKKPNTSYSTWWFGNWNICPRKIKMAKMIIISLRGPNNSFF